jgi:hypothetical protein
VENEEFVLALKKKEKSNCWILIGGWHKIYEIIACENE